jgi:hypothetical protein
LESNHLISCSEDIDGGGAMKLQFRTGSGGILLSHPLLSEEEYPYLPVEVFISVVIPGYGPVVLAIKSLTDYRYPHTWKEGLYDCSNKACS